MENRKLDIKKARERVGVTQGQLAKVTNVAQPTVACWETGRSTPSAEKLPVIANECQCSIDDLFSEKEC